MHPESTDSESSPGQAVSSITVCSFLLAYFIAFSREEFPPPLQTETSDAAQRLTKEAIYLPTTLVSALGAAWKVFATRMSSKSGSKLAQNSIKIWRKRTKLHHFCVKIHPNCGKLPGQSPIDLSLARSIVKSYCFAGFGVAHEAEQELYR